MGQYAAQHEKRNPWYPSSKFDADVRGFGAKLDGMGASIDSRLILEVGVGSAVSASLARQIESALDWPDRVEGASVAALERHFARPVVVDPVLVA